MTDGTPCTLCKWGEKHCVIKREAPTWFCCRHGLRRYFGTLINGMNRRLPPPFPLKELLWSTLFWKVIVTKVGLRLREITAAAGIKQPSQPTIMHKHIVTWLSMTSFRNKHTYTHVCGTGLVGRYQNFGTFSMSVCLYVCLSVRGGTLSKIWRCPT